jgi:hypothetical protein
MSSNVQVAAADEQQRAGGSCRYAAACRWQIQICSSVQVAAADVRVACRWQLWMSSVQEAAADERQRAGGSCR